MELSTITLVITIAAILVTLLVTLIIYNRTKKQYKKHYPLGNFDDDLNISNRIIQKYQIAQKKVATSDLFSIILRRFKYLAVTIYG